MNEPGRRAEDDVNLVAATLGSEWGRNRGLGLANETDTLALSVSKQTRLDGTVETFILDEQNAASVEAVGALGTGLAHSNRGFSVTHALTGEGHDASEDGTGRGTPLLVCGGSDPILAEDMSFPLTGRHGDQTAVAFDWQKGGSSERAWIQRAGDYAGSLGSTKRDAIASPTLGVRRLMPVECERLQGFPDGWTCLQDHPQQCDCPDSPRYRALGNAVAVPVAEWILRWLAAA